MSSDRWDRRWGTRPNPEKKWDTSWGSPLTPTRSWSPAKPADPPPSLVADPPPSLVDVPDPIPAVSPAPVDPDAVVLGHDISTGEAVPLGVVERMGGLYVIGKNGTGKSSLIASLVAQDMRHGHGVCVLDPHGDLTRHVISLVPPERRSDVLLLDAGNQHTVFGLNLFESDGTDYGIARSADAVVQSFKRAWGSLGWGARLEMTLYNLAYALASADKTLADVPDFFYRDEVRQRVLAQVDNPNVVDFWRYEYDGLTPTQQRELRSSTFNKIKLFLDNPLVARIVGQQQSSVDWSWAMDWGQIVLVRLPEGEIGEGAVNLLGSTIVDQIATAVRSRAILPEAQRRPFFLFADEFHRFATAAFAKLLDELRKYGIATLMAHQRRAQLAEEARESALGARNFVVFEVTAKDAAELGHEMSTGEDTTVTPMNLYEQLERKGHPNPTIRQHFPMIRDAVESYPSQKRMLSRLWAVAQDREDPSPSDLAAVWSSILPAALAISQALAEQPIRIRFEDHAPEETFARLPPFTARVKLRQGQATIERTIHTSKPDAPPGDWEPQPVGTPVHQLQASTTRRDTRVSPEEDEPMSPPPDQRQSPAAPRPSRRRVVIARDGQNNQGET